MPKKIEVKKVEVKRETIRKDDIIRIIAKDTGLEIKTCKNVIDLFLQTISDQLVAGNKIALHNFGSFNPTLRSARKGHDPRTQKEIKIPAKKSANFKLSKPLKNAINGEK